MGVGIVLFYIVAIIGAYHLDVKLFGVFEQSFVGNDLIPDTVPLDFDVVIVAKQIQPPFELLPTGFFAFFDDGLRHTCPNAAGSGDQAFVVFYQ